jgi:hypothetical protein
MFIVYVWDDITDLCNRIGHLSTCRRQMAPAVILLHVKAAPRHLENSPLSLGPGVPRQDRTLLVGLIEFLTATVPSWHICPYSGGRNGIPV